MKIMNIAMNDQKEAIINEGIAINLDSSDSRTLINVCLSLGEKRGMQLE